MGNDSISAVQKLYQLMTDNKNLSGSFELVSEDLICWDLFDGFTIFISEDDIGIERLLFKKTPVEFTHWHPTDDEIYNDICNMGTKGNVTVIYKSILGESILYSGSKNECKYKRKWLFGKYYYLYTKN